MSFHFDPLKKKFQPEHILCPKCNKVVDLPSSYLGIIQCSNTDCGNIFIHNQIRINHLEVPQSCSYDQVICPLTGGGLQGCLGLDWNQYGGNSNRTFCLADSLGAFGKPNTQEYLFLDKFKKTEVVPQERPDILHLNSVRGQLLCTTKDGMIYRYHHILEHPDDWIKMNTISCDFTSTYGNSIEVKYSPAFSIDKNKQVFSLTLFDQANLHQNLPLLFRSFHLEDKNISAVNKTIPPKNGCKWLSAPLLIEKGIQPIFAVWQGRFEKYKIVDDELVFFTVDGEEIGRVETNTVRPPVYNSDLDAFLIFDGNRIKKMRMLKYNLIDNHIKTNFHDIDINIPRVYLHETSQPLFVLIKTISNQFELWGVNKHHHTGKVQICKFIFTQSQQILKYEVQMSFFKETNIPFEDITGVSVGYSSLYQKEHYVTQLAVSTLNRGVYVFSKSDPDSSFKNVVPVRSLRGDIVGMSSPPIITPAAIIFSMADNLKLSSDFGWKYTDKLAKYYIKSRDAFAYGHGLCILGKRIFTGDGKNVLCYDIQLKNYVNQN